MRRRRETIDEFIMKKREKMMEKIIKTAEVKVRLREKELFAMDKELEADIFGTTVAENEARLNKKVREIE